MRTINEIIKTTGGPSLICLRSGKKPGQRPALTESAVHKWRVNGIPEKHWPLIIEMADSSPDELFQANQALKLDAAATIDPESDLESGEGRHE